MDRFKQYLRDNKDNFEEEFPPESIWSNIKSEIDERKKKVVYKKIISFSLAACFIIISCIGIWKIFAKETSPVNIRPHLYSIGRSKPKYETTLARSKPSKEIHDISINNKHQFKKTVKSTRLLFSHPNSFKEVAKLEIGKKFDKIISVEVKQINEMPLYAGGASYFDYYLSSFKQAIIEESSINEKIVKSGPNDELVSELIETYQQKLNILKDLQTEIQKANNLFMQNRLPSELGKPTFLTI